MAYALLVTALMLNACANLFIKVGVVQFREAPDANLPLRLLGSPALLVGLLLFAVNVVCYVAALSQLRLSVAYPVMAAGSLVVVALCSVLWLGETVTPLQWSGIALLLVGIVLVTSRTAA